MRSHPALIALLGASLLLTSFLGAGPALAAEGGCSGNRLLNPSFEDGYRQTSLSSHTANGWHPWFRHGPGVELGYNLEPEYKGEDAARFGFRRVLHGWFSQKFFNTFGTHDAGFFQTAGVPAGSRVRFSIWVQVWSTHQDALDSMAEPGNYWLQVGIDPAGGTLWSSPGVVWSEPVLGSLEWQQLVVEAQAGGERVTVFTRGAPEWRVKHNDSYWDDACLQVLGQAPPRLASAPPSSSAQVASGTATGGAAYVVRRGDTLGAIARRFDTTVEALARLNNIRNVNLIYVGQLLQIP